MTLLGKRSDFLEPKPKENTDRTEKKKIKGNKGAGNPPNETTTSSDSDFDNKKIKTPTSK